MANPRLGLSTHVGTGMVGTFVLAVGAAWSELRLGRTEAVTYWILLIGSYGSSLSLLLGAVLGTHSGTPIAGAGHSASPAAEALVNFGLQSTGFAMLVACFLLFRGVRRPAA
jgi:hydroxylaminobenzene mutase